MYLTGAIADIQALAECVYALKGPSLPFVLHSTSNLRGRRYRRLSKDVTWAVEA